MPFLISLGSRAVLFFFGRQMMGAALVGLFVLLIAAAALAFARIRKTAV